MSAVETLFDAEADLRLAACSYRDSKTNTTRAGLRRAAIKYAAVAGALTDEQADARVDGALAAVTTP